jgi:shikimate 5-dehydrogenase
MREKLIGDLSLNGGSDLEHQGGFNADLVANATPDSTENSPLHVALHNNARIIFDAVYQQKRTALETIANESGKIYIHGLRMFLHQGARQFELYTGENAPIEAMEKAVKAFVFGN